MTLRTGFVGMGLTFAAVWLAACATNPATPTPFTRDWHEDVQGDRAFQKRLERLRGDDEVVLAGEEGKARAAVYMDEKGRPRLNVGQQTGLSADLDYDDGPEATLKYKVKWDFAKPNRKE